MTTATMWERVKGGSKKGFDAGWKALDKLGAPTNRLSNKLGSEAFWPTSLDKESDKAARILKSFCKDGFYQDETELTLDGPKQKQRVLKKIPQDIIRNAKGLAIFTTMRTGLWVSGAGGSGVLIARQEDGSWSPPSGILLHTAGLGFLVGIDIYDCVVVINSERALEAFTKIRCTLGSEISVTAGPVGAGGVLESEVHKRQAPIFTYMKSRGFYAGVQIDGTVIIERTDENERFYNERIPVAEILAGKARHPPTHDYRRLTETLKAAQGDANFDEAALPSEPPPSDFLVENGHVFGVPEKDDPDPFGVLALEKEGLSLREAGSQKRASWQEFAFNPVPSSPIHNVYARNTQDRQSVGGRGAWRTSSFPAEPKTPSATSSSRSSADHTRPTMVDSSTQTDFFELPSPSRYDSLGQHNPRVSLGAAHQYLRMPDVPENEVLSTTRDITSNRLTPGATQVNGYTTPPGTPPASSTEIKTDKLPIVDHHVLEESPVVPVVHTIQAVQAVEAVQTKDSNAPQLISISKPRIVNVPKRIPPQLPPRNPNREQSSKDLSPSLSSPESESEVFSPAAQDVDDQGRDERANDIAVGQVQAAIVDVSLEDNQHGEHEADKNRVRVKEETPKHRSDTENQQDKLVVKETSRHSTIKSDDLGKMPGGFE